MTTYTTIASTESDPLAPLISSLVKRMIDNPVAIAEFCSNVRGNPVGQ